MPSIDNESIFHLLIVLLLASSELGRRANMGKLRQQWLFSLVIEDLREGQKSAPICAKICQGPHRFIARLTQLESSILCAGTDVPSPESHQKQWVRHGRPAAWKHGRVEDVLEVSVLVEICCFFGFRGSLEQRCSRWGCRLACARLEHWLKTCKHTEKQVNEVKSVKNVKQEVACRMWMHERYEAS